LVIRLKNYLTVTLNRVKTL